MRIERVEIVPYALPFREPYVTARGSLHERELVLVRLHADTGLEGLGEAVPLTLRGGDDPATVTLHLTDAAERLVGLELGPGDESPLDVAIATMLQLTRPRKLPAPAVAALECALFDLAARELDVPVWKLLGAEDAAPIECNATLTSGEPAAVAEQARSWAADGHRTFKLKLGTGGDASQVEAVRDAIGPDARIRVDANEAWEMDEAVSVLTEIEQYDIELAEQPVSGLRAMARLAQRTPIPLAADEAVTGEAEAHRAREQSACEFATVKLSKVGGMGAASAIAAVLPTYVSSALDGPVGIAAAAHAVQVLRARAGDHGLAHGLATQRLFADSVATRACELRDGRLYLPDGPGLGVELDEEALENARR